MKSVVRASADSSTSARCTPSTLETNSQRGDPAVKARSACTAMAGPKSEPPIPIFTMSVKRWPLLPRMAPPRTPSANSSIRARSASTSLSMSAPPTAAPAGWRSATCSTARPSVGLMISPHHMASMRARKRYRVGEPEEPGEGRLIEPLAREVHEEPLPLAREALEPLRVALEEVAHRDRPEAYGVRLEFAPRRGAGPGS